MKIERWQDLEKKGALFLSRLFACVQFEASGGSNANESDIVVTTHNGKYICSIEAKMTPAQAGQITLVDDGDTSSFLLSKRSRNPKNPYDAKIIGYLNSHYEHFSPADRSGKSLDIPESLLIGWVKSHYKSKGNSWILSVAHGAELSKERVTLVPIDELEHYFTVHTSFRVKQSGSQNISKKRKAEAIAAIQKRYPDVDASTDIDFDTRKMYLKKDIGNGKVRLEDGYFIGEKRDDGCYVITRRNLTKKPNPNIMFVITLKSSNFQEDAFKKFLKSVGVHC